jgi:hypothetical protein
MVRSGLYIDGVGQKRSKDVSNRKMEQKKFGEAPTTSSLDSVQRRGLPQKILLENILSRPPGFEPDPWLVGPDRGQIRFENAIRAK